MAQAKIEYFPDEQDAVMELLLLAEELLDLKTTKAPVRNPTSGKIHLYFETVDHKKRTNGRGQIDKNEHLCYNIKTKVPQR